MTDRPARYVARYTRADGAWIVQFQGPDIATFGRTLASAKRHARSALAVFLEVSDLAAAGVEVVDDVQLPTEISETVSKLAEERGRIDRLRAELASSTRNAATSLRRMGLSTRDVGEILGISGARVGQIEREVDGT